MLKRLMILGSLLLLPVLATAPVVQAEAPRSEADIATTELATQKLAEIAVHPQKDSCWDVSKMRLLAQAPVPNAAPAAPAKADWSKRARGYKPAPPEVRAKLHAEAFKRHGHRMAHHVRSMTAPTTWDSRTLGWIPPIRDQGSCGDCYGVSASDITTCAFVKAGIQKADGSFVISEQYGLDCGAYQGGCGGGDGPQVMDWIKSKGFPAEKYVDSSGKAVNDYPGYTAQSGRCQLTSSMKLWKPADWLYVTSDQSDRAPTVDEVKAGVMNYGAVSFSFDASNLDTVVTRLGNSIDHEITGFIGWDDSKKMFLCRNQWGASFGDGGCFWLAYSCLPQVQEPYAVVAAALPPPDPGPGPGPGPNPNPGTAPVITSAATAAGSVGSAFSYQITASNTPTAFAASGLPAGLTVSTATGLISGTPTTAATSNVTILAANSTGTGTATLALTITVGPPGAVSIVLTPDQVKSVVSQSGAIIVTPGMTVEELMKAMAAAKTQQSAAPPKDCGTCQRMTKLEVRVANTESNLDRLTAALVKLLTPSTPDPAKKEPAALPSKP